MPLTDNLPVLIAAIVAVVVVLALLLGARARRRKSADEDLVLPPVRPDLSPEDELRSLGITAPPRPRDPKSRHPDYPESYAPIPSEEELAVAPPPSVPPPPPSVQSARQGPRVRRPLPTEDLAPEEAQRGATDHLLQALQLAAGAHTVGLFEQGGNPGAYRYNIVSLYSHSPFARSAGAFTTRHPLVPPGEHHAVLHRVGERGLAAETLRYYREEISALRGLLAMPFRAHGEDYVLLLDTKEEGRLEGPRVRELAEGTARMLEQLRPAPEGMSAGMSAPPSADTPAPTSERPSRRAIIAEELALADEQGLTLALVHVDALDADASESTRAQAEADFEQHLRSMARGSRVEQFAEMTFGLFLHDTSDAVDAWVDETAQHLRSLYPDARIAFGAACMTDPGKSPEEVRAFAERALAQSYEAGGEPVILG